MSSGGVLHAISRRGIEPPKLKLPGPSPKEAHATWSLVKELEKIHGRQEGIESIDYDRLPSGPDDMDPEKIAYARQLQMLVVPNHKLGNIPELKVTEAPIKGTLPVARPYHVSRTKLQKMLGGGWHFVDAYRKEHGLPMQLLERPDGNGFSRYMIAEHAAIVWAVYKAIPEAGANDRCLQACGSGSKSDLT